jgi:hypothetical protein
MDWNTRNRIHEARRLALAFPGDPATVSARDLVDAFFSARRALRQDLGFKDARSSETIKTFTS